MMDPTTMTGLTMTDFPECEQLTGRMRKLCRGEVQTRAKQNAYREMLGLEPLPPLYPSVNTGIQRGAPANGSPLPKKSCRRGKPGNELTALLQSLGIDSKWCKTGCSGFSAKMNAWGVQGCKERRAEIVKRLEEQQQTAGVAVTAKAAAMALVTGVAFEIDLTDPLGWLADEAIRRAERAETCATGCCDA